MSTRFSKARFHIQTGPASLFERVHFKMDSIQTVNLTTHHAKQRIDERSIPTQVIERIKVFRLLDWKLVTCEVRTDTGKFVNSTWETMADNKTYWLTIGFGNVAETIVEKTSSGFGSIITQRELFDFVDSVNSRLMQKDK